MADSSFKSITLGELIDTGVIQVTTGFPFGGHNINGDGVPHIRPFNVGTDGEIYLDQIKSIPAAAATGKPQLHRGDIVFNNTNTKELVGKCALWSSEEQSVFSNHMTRVRVADASCDSAYLSFAILHHWMTGKSEMLARSHVAQASIIGSRFREIEVPWPGPAEQRSIGSLVDRVRAASRSEATQLAHARLLKRAVMAKLFTLSLGGEAQKETEIGKIPESWNVVTINDVAVQTQYGLSVRGQASGRTPILRMNCQDDGRVMFRDLQYVDLDDGTLAAFRLRLGDLLFNRTNSIDLVGRTAIFDGAQEAVFASYLIRLSVDAKRCLPHFLNYYMNRTEVQADIKRLASRAVGQANINATKLRTVAFPLPPSIDEQREIIAVIAAIDEKIKLHQDRREVLDNLFKTLLHKLMTGEIRVTDLDLSAIERQGAAA